MKDIFWGGGTVLYLTYLIVIVVTQIYVLKLIKHVNQGGP